MYVQKKRKSKFTDRFKYSIQYPTNPSGFKYKYLPKKEEKSGGLNRFLHAIFNITLN